MRLIETNCHYLSVLYVSVRQYFYEFCASLVKSYIKHTLRFSAVKCSISEIGDRMEFVINFIQYLYALLCNNVNNILFIKSISLSMSSFHFGCNTIRGNY